MKLRFMFDYIARSVDRAKKGVKNAIIAIFTISRA